MHHYTYPISILIDFLYKIRHPAIYKYRGICKTEVGPIIMKIQKKKKKKKKKNDKSVTKLILQFTHL